MIANGYDIAVLEHHTSSSSGGFYNQYSQARISYYSISSIPHIIFDGVINQVGAGTGAYAQFVVKYDNRMAVASDFNMSINGTHEDLSYSVTLTMENVNPNSSNNLVAHLFVTESGCSYGSDIFNYVTRLMVPSTSGTPVDFSTNPNQFVELDFDLDPAWVVDNCEFVAFIQDNTTKEILQAEKVAVNDLMPLYYNNAGCVAMNEVPVMNCDGYVEPMVTITNGGADNLTSVDINYQVNDQTLNTFNWTGDLGYGETENVTLPSLTFTPAENYNLLVYTDNPNGNPDENTVDDTTSMSFNNAAEVIPDIYLYLKLDDNPEETSYELKNSAGNVLYSGGSYTNPGQFVKDTFALSLDDCYTFIINDAGGDGLQGNAYYSLMGSNFNMFYDNHDFASSQELVQFTVDLVSVNNIAQQEPFTVFPNPAEENAYVEITLDGNETVEIQVYNVIGKLVYREVNEVCHAGRNVIMIDVGSMNPGVYFVAAKIGDHTYTRKISVY